MTYSLLTEMQDFIACDLQQYTLIEIKGEDAEKILTRTINLRCKSTC
ncbi:glycine cleavage T-protein family protein [Pasteurella canis]|nr:glycine cleavage T-protein family protein [Pasteurella canis]